MQHRVNKSAALGSRPLPAALLLGAAHWIADMATVAALMEAARTGAFAADWAALMIFGYDFIAFAAQPFLGYMMDRRGWAAGASALGCAAAMAGVWLAGSSPVAAAAIAALGNALFHAGGGALCLRLEPGRAAWAGIFVAPGAIGLFLGRQIGGTPLFAPWALTLLLLAAAWAGPALRMPRRAVAPAFPAVRGAGIIAAVLLTTVAVRSLVGSCLNFPWASGWQGAACLTAAVFAGKALGGLLGDRLGWRNVTVAGLLISAPLLAFARDVPWASVAGLLFFNLTMAVTLAGLARLLPGYEGFAFGLTAGAIVTGMMPALVPAWLPALASPLAVLGIIGAAAATLFPALGRLERGVAYAGQTNQMEV